MMGKVILALILTVAGTELSAQSCSGISTGYLGSLNNYQPFPGSDWYTDVSGWSVDAASASIMSTPGGGLASRHLHPDFGGGGQYGIPYDVVDSSATNLVSVDFDSFPGYAYPDDSDISKYPFTSTTHIEGNVADGSNDTSGDRHALVIDRAKCAVYEAYPLLRNSDHSTFTGGQVTIWDMTGNAHRPWGITSADAAGLSVFAGLVRYDEVLAGEIKHAIRFTMLNTNNNANNGRFVLPATHAAGTPNGTWGSQNYLGMRIRLKADFDTSSYSATNKIILTAMKKYGLILADNGSDFYISGTSDSRWNDSELDALKAIPSSAFEVVKASPLHDSETHPVGTGPSITSFHASEAKIALGASVTLIGTHTGDYAYTDAAGLFRGSETLTPTETTTYHLISRNIDGTATAAQTVTVLTNVSTLNLPATSGKVLAGYHFQLGATCTFVGGDTLPCPVSFTGVSEGEVYSATPATVTGAAQYRTITKPLSFTVVDRPPQFGGRIARGGR